MTVTTYRPNDIDLIHCKVFNHRGGVLDLRDMILEFNCYSDVFDSGMKVELVVGDAKGLVERLPVVGDEKLYLEFKTPTFERPVKYLMDAYKVSDRTHHKDRMDTYVLHGCSPEVIMSQRVMVDRAFKDMTVSDMVAAVYRTHLVPKSGLRVEKGFSAEPTEGKFYYVGHSKRPLEAIRELCGEASSSGSSLFFFYEDEDGWKFRSLDSMVGSEASDKFYFADASVHQDPGSVEPDSAVFPRHKVMSLSYSRSIDILEKYSDGMMAGPGRSFDVLKKELYEKPFDVVTGWGRIPVLDQGGRLLTSDTAHGGAVPKRGEVEYSEVGRNYATGYLSRGKDSDPRIRCPSRRSETSSLRKAALSAMDSLAVDVVVPGNTDLRVGTVVDLHVQQTSLEEDLRNRDNLLFGTRFLVTAVRHSYSKPNNAFMTSFQAVKTAYAVAPKELG